MTMQRIGLRLISLAIVSLWCWSAVAQVYPNIPANTILGRLGSGNPGPPQPIPFVNFSGKFPLGPSVTTIGHVAIWANTIGTLLGDEQYIPLASGGLGGSQAAATTGQIPVYPGSGGAAVPTTLPPTQQALTTNTIFYYSTTGNNSTGNGTSGNPWATPLGAYNNIQKLYNAAGFQITISPKAAECATYTSSNQLSGMITGQAGPVIFAGNGGGSGQAGAPAKCTVIQPSAASGYSFSAVSGANIKLQGMYLDQTNGTNDTIVAGTGGSITIGADIVFGPNIYPYNNMTIANGGYLNVIGNGTAGKDAYSIDETVITVPVQSLAGTCTASSANNSLAVTNANATGILQYMGVEGTGIPPGTYVSAISSGGGNTTFSLSYVAGVPSQALTSTCSGNYTFTSGGQDHLLAGGAGANVYYNTNGDPNFPLVITVLNGAHPAFLAGTINAYLGAQINIQAVGWSPTVVTSGRLGGPINALPFSVDSSADISTNFQGVPYFSGTVGNTEATTATCASGSNALTVAANNGIQVGNAVTAYNATTTTFTASTNPITVASATGIANGDIVVGNGVPPGDYVTNVSGTSITLKVAPYANSGASAPIWFLKPSALNAKVTNVSGTSLIVSPACGASLSSQTVYFGGLILHNGQYDQNVPITSLTLGGTNIPLGSTAAVSGTPVSNPYFSNSLTMTGNTVGNITTLGTTPNFVTVEGLGTTSPNVASSATAGLHVYNALASGLSGVRLQNADPTGGAASDMRLFANTGLGQILMNNNVPLYLGANNINWLEIFTTGGLGLFGSSTGQVSILTQAAAGSYNFNLPITAGSANQPLLSQGGGSTAMTWSGISYPTSATSGGVPYFSSTSAMGSSALLATNAIVVGGGAGNPPLTQATTPPTVDGNGILTVVNATDASAIGTASAVVTGGLSVAKKSFLGDNVTITQNTNPQFTFGTTGNVNAFLKTQGQGSFSFQAGGGTIFNISPVNTSTQANYMQWVSNIAGSAPYVSSQGTDTNIGMTFISKGTGTINFQVGSNQMIYGGTSLSVQGLTSVATTSALCYNTSTGAVTYDGTIGTCTISDERLKNMGPRIDDALNKLLRINGIYYTWKDQKAYGKGRQIGIGAQTVERVFPELVQTDSKGTKSVDYVRLIAPTIEAIRQLKADNDNLKERIAKLERRAAR